MSPWLLVGFSLILAGFGYQVDRKGYPDAGTALYAVGVVVMVVAVAVALTAEAAG